MVKAFTATLAAQCGSLRTLDLAVATSLRTWLNWKPFLRAWGSLREQSLHMNFEALNWLRSMWISMKLRGQRTQNSVGTPPPRGPPRPDLL